MFTYLLTYVDMTIANSALALCRVCKSVFN